MPIPVQAPATPVGPTVALFEAVARWLADTTSATYRPESPYQVGEVPITHRHLPDADTAIAVTFYDTTPDPIVGVDEVAMQIRARGPAGDPDTPENLADEVFAVAHSATHLHLPTGLAEPATVVISQCLHASGAPIGMDAAGRWERADNYTLTVPRPTQHRH